MYSDVILYSLGFFLLSNGAVLSELGWAGFFVPYRCRIQGLTQKLRTSFSPSQYADHVQIPSAQGKFKKKLYLI